MSITPPAPPNAPVETKVKAATVAAGGSATAITAIVYAVLAAIWPNMDEASRVTISALVAGALTAVVTFYAGWKAKHTPRGTAALPPVTPPPAAYPHPPA